MLRSKLSGSIKKVENQVYRSNSCIKEGGEMTVDVFPVASSEFEPEVFVKEEVTTEDAEELELEDPTVEAVKVENQEDWEDPIRLYLHEIGRVPLLSASE